MSNYLLLDGDAIQNAFKAGGIPLVDKYLNFVEARVARIKDGNCRVH